MFAAIDFRIAAPGFLHIAASLFQHIVGIEPALKMSAAELALFVLLVAGLIVPNSPADLHSTRAFKDKKAGVLGTPVSSVIGWFARIELVCVERALLPAPLTA